MKIVHNFLKSQQRPILITTGIKTPITQSVSALCWNFRKADWKSYNKYIEEICRGFSNLER
jgi:hypothetical protein